MDILSFWLLALGVAGAVIYVWRWRQRNSREQEFTGNFNSGSSHDGNQQTHAGSRSGPGAGHRGLNPTPPGRLLLEQEIEQIKTMVQNLNTTSSSLQTELHNLTGLVEEIMPALERIEQSRSNPTPTPPDVTPTVATHRREPLNLVSASAAYRKLSLDGYRDLPIEPLFVTLDMDSSARGSAIGETKRRFNQSESKHSAFVVFPQDQNEGWIYPNPQISFTEAMKYVFPDLNYENFEDAKDRVEPRKVRSVSESAWETVGNEF